MIELGRSPDTAVTPQAVYGWLAGETSPLPSRAQALVELSQGSLTMDAIYAHRQELSKTA